MGKEFLKMLFDKSIGFKILKSAKRVIAVSNIEVEQYMKMGVERDRISLIPNGINISEFENADKVKGNFRRAYKLSDKKILLFHLLYFEYILVQLCFSHSRVDVLVF